MKTTRSYLLAHVLATYRCRLNHRHEKRHDSNNYKAEPFFSVSPSARVSIDDVESGSLSRLTTHASQQPQTNQLLDFARLARECDRLRPHLQPARDQQNEQVNDAYQSAWFCHRRTRLRLNVRKRRKQQQTVACRVCV